MELPLINYFWTRIGSVAERKTLAVIIFRYGSGGEQEKKNALCILGLNMINDKIFLVVWFWYFFLLIVGVFRLCYRIVTVSFWKIRSCNSWFHLILTHLL